MPLFLPTKNPLVDKALMATQSMYAWMRDLTAAFNGGNGFAPADATYVLKTADSSLPNGQVATSSVTVTVNTATPNVIKWDAVNTGTVTTTGSPANGNLTKFSGATSITNGDLSGDVTTSGTLVTTIANNAVTFAKMQDITTQRAIGRNTAGTGDPEEVTISQMLDWTA